MVIRPVTPNDFREIQEIELEAGTMFAAIGMHEVAADPPFSLEELARFVEAGLAWVAVDAADRPVGYLVARRADGRLHLEQVSVRPSHARRGTGRKLVDHLVQHAIGAGVRALTLTTFVDVPWNAPLYERLGFSAFEVDAESPELRAIRAQEAARGLDRWPRIAMIKPTSRDAT